MVRIQLHLTEAQDKALRALAKRRHTTRADVIRRGIDLVLAEDEAGDPLLALIGTAPQGPFTALSEDHDALLYGGQGEAPQLPLAADEPRDVE